MEFRASPDPGRTLAYQFSILQLEYGCRFSAHSVETGGVNSRWVGLHGRGRNEYRLRVRFFHILRSASYMIFFAATFYSRFSVTCQRGITVDELLLRFRQIYARQRAAWMGCWRSTQSSNFDVVLGAFSQSGLFLPDVSCRGRSTTWISTNI